MLDLLFALHLSLHRFSVLPCKKYKNDLTLHFLILFVWVPAFVYLLYVLSIFISFIIFLCSFDFLTMLAYSYMNVKRKRKQIVTATPRLPFGLCSAVGRF